MANKTNKEAVSDYQKNHDAIMLRPTKKDGERIRKYAEKHGASVQGLIFAALLDYMKARKTPPPKEKTIKKGGNSFDELDEVERIEEAQEAIKNRNTGWRTF